MHVLGALSVDELCSLVQSKGSEGLKIYYFYGNRHVEAWERFYYQPPDRYLVSIVGLNFQSRCDWKGICYTMKRGEAKCFANFWYAWAYKERMKRDERQQ